MIDKKFIDNPVEAYEKLKAENEKLKEKIEIRDNLSEKFRKEALSWANIANEYQKDKTKLERCLQDIKNFCNAFDGSNPDVKEVLRLVKYKITKAEEE